MSDSHNQVFILNHGVFPGIGQIQQHFNQLDLFNTKQFACSTVVDLIDATSFQELAFVLRCSMYTKLYHKIPCNPMNLYEMLKIK